MKKLFTILTFALCFLLSAKAQTEITVLNQDFEDTTTPLALNANNQYAIKGFYLVDNAKKPASTSLDYANSGLVFGLGVNGSQTLKLTPVQPDATTNAANHIFDLTTEKIDIGDRAFGEYTYTFQEKVTEAMASVRPVGFVMFAYDEDGVDVTAATLTVNKTAQTALNSSSDFQTNINVFQTLGSVFSIQANASGKNAKYITVAISFGKNLPASLTTPLYFDNFKLVGPALTALNQVNSNLNVRIYPNPVQNFAQIDCADGIEEVSLVSVTGSIINKTNVRAISYKLDISSLANGVYFISVKNNKGVSTTKITKI